MKSKIKICGIQRLEEITILNKYLPDYAGFVFASGRHRAEPDQVMKLCKSLNINIKRVGVFVNELQDKVLKTAEQCRLDVIQLHGDETEDYILKLKDKIKGNEIKIWKAFRVAGSESVITNDNSGIDACLFDTYSNGVYGGSGKTFDWSLISDLSKKYKIVLAGGLNSENVLKAKETVMPHCFDVSSGVEINRYKDEEKVREFIYKVRGI